MAGPWEKYGAQTKPANQMLPGQVQGQALDNAGKSINVQKDSATLPYDIRAARAKAEKDELDLRQSRIEQGLDPVTGRPVAADGPPSGVSGTAYLKTLPADQQRLVQAMADGRLIPPTGRAAASPYWQKLIGQTLQYDPSFDAIDYGARYNTRRDFTSGKSAQNIKALNTAIGHVAQLADQINGTAANGGFPFATTINRIENAYARGSGDSGITKFSQTAGAVASELTQVFRGTTGAESDVQRYLSELDPNASLDQKKAAVANILGLLKSRLDALNDQYRKGMGAASAPLDVLDDHSKQSLTKYLPGFDVSQYGGPPSGPHGGGDGGKNLSELSPGGDSFNAAPTQSNYRDIPDPQVAAMIDQSVRQNVPYGKFLRDYRQQFPQASIPLPSEYNAARRYHADHPNYQGSFGSATKTIPLSDKGIIPGTSLFSERDMNQAAQTGAGALLGHMFNMGSGGLPVALAGDQGAYFNAVSNQQHPALSTLGDIGGAVAGSLGAGKLLKTAAPALGRLGAFATATPGRTALLGDLLYGGETGAVSNPDHPVLGGALGAASMGAGNAAGRFVLGPVLARAGDTKIAQTLGDMIRGPGNSAPPAPLTPAQNIVLRQTGNAVDDITANMQDAARLGMPYALADAHPKLRLLAGSATRKSPDVRALAENTLGPRQMGQAERAVGMIDEHLAPSGDIPTIKADALTRAQAQSAPLYAKAMDHPAPVDEQLSEMLRTPAGEQAARDAYAIALNKGENPAELSFATAPDGSPIINANPNWKTLQYIKQGFDKVVTDNQNPVTGKLDLGNPANRALNDLRARFVGRLGELNPDYAEANKVFADIADQGSAAARGAKAQGSRTNIEQTQIAVGNTKPDSLPLFRRGYASSMADAVDNARLSGDPYNAVYGSPAQQAKLAAVFPEGAPTFARGRQLESDMSKTAYETLGGSPTAARMESDKLFDSPIGDAANELGTMAITGGVPTPRMMGRIALKLGDLRQLGLRGAQQKADQIGPILLNTDPEANLLTLGQLLRQQQARQAYTNQARTLGGLVGAPILFGLRPGT